MNDFKEMVDLFGNEFAAKMAYNGHDMEEAKIQWAKLQKEQNEKMHSEIEKLKNELSSKDIEIGTLKSEIENLKSKPAPVAYAEQQEQKEEPKPTYKSMVAEYEKKGMSRKDAILATARNFPDLHKEYIANANK